MRIFDDVSLKPFVLSHLARFSGSLIVSYAFDSCWNLFVASGSCGFCTTVYVMMWPKDHQQVYKDVIKYDTYDDVRSP